MAILGRIRNHSGLLIAIIGIALAGFVLQDFFKKSEKSGYKDFGAVDGDKIAYKDYNDKVEEQLTQMKKQSEGQNIEADKIYQLRQQMWTQMVKEIIMQKQYDELGLIVTKNELYDLVQGKDPHQYILQSFSNPKTKQLDRERLSQFLRNFDQLEPDIKNQWINLERAIKEERINKKYNNLISNGYYIPKFMAKRTYLDKSEKVKGRFFQLPYSSVQDTNITVTKEELEKTYNEHKQEYEQAEETRAIDYIVWDVQPSAEDMQLAKQDIDKVKQELEKLTDKDIPNFVNMNSDKRYDSTWLAKGKLPANLDTAFFKEEPVKPAKPVKQSKSSAKQKNPAPGKQTKTAVIGKLIGPILDKNEFTIAKLIDVQNRPDSMKASHILISFQGSDKADPKIKRTKIQAKAKADSILSVLKKTPAEFVNFAKKMSDDPSAKEKGGDLGWFADGSMVYAFNKACIDGNVGDIVLVETGFGFHVLSITGKKDAVKKVRVAIIKRNVDPSTKTIQEIYTKVSRFAGENRTLDAFRKSAVKLALNKRSADFLKVMDNTIPGLDQSREIVRWVFEEKTEVGAVKDFEIENKYVVAALKEIKPKGIPTIDMVMKNIKPLAKKDKKAETFIKKIEEASKSASTFEALSKALNCKVDTAKELTFTSYSLPGTGPEQVVIGKIFTMKKSVMSKPIKGTQGVFVFIVDDQIPAPPKEKFNDDISTLSYFKSRVGWEVYNALEKNAKIMDNRKFFY